ncbi:BrnT family toxin [Methylocaldum gracile subsp. desertum]|uniref:BrnT family toxin n=1 Tax=Methylocaldum sp. GT1BW TaxID=3438964 RepID=UPI003DA01CC6
MYADGMDIEFDPQKVAANLRKHGASFAHAETALRDPNALTIEDPDAEGEQRLVTLGMDALGRILVVVHAPRGDRTRLISARKASPKECEAYA